MEGAIKKDNPEKLATKGTHDKEKHNKNTTKYVLATSTDQTFQSFILREKYNIWTPYNT